ncbi:MAG: methyltransferase domain-containing protein [Candidatus Omnitrophota bacterium]
METTSNHALLMDRIYRFQRYIYDLTRKYYLLGRDRLIRQMRIEPGERILEIGCGTARNLILMARRHPQVRFYGLDASKEMLITAEAKVKRAGLEDRIALRQCLAEELDAKKTFDLDAPFDGIFFSYSLSMIPAWKEALQTAFEQLQPDGKLAIVDFCDQQDLPRWFRKILAAWLFWFHVRRDPALLNFLPILSNREQAKLQIEYLYKRYAFMATITKQN